MKSGWLMENNNFRYYNENGDMIVQIFKHQGYWKGFVLGHDKPIKKRRFTDALEEVRIFLKECGWES